VISTGMSIQHYMKIGHFIESILWRDPRKETAKINVIIIPLEYKDTFTSLYSIYTYYKRKYYYHFVFG
jgi:hypothetical protein